MGTGDPATDLVLLVQTRLHRPPVSLENRLDQGLGRILVLVSAPARYGKATLVVPWLAACHSLAAWLSLREGDGGLVTFAHYLLAAMLPLPALRARREMPELRTDDLHLTLDKARAFLQQSMRSAVP